MKKTVAFILAFMYLGLTSGLAVNIHYCMGKISGVKIDSYQEAACKCGKKTAMPCCNDQFELVKVADAHQQAAVDFTLKSPEVTLHSIENLIVLLTAPKANTAIVVANAPPLLTPPGIYLLNCVFRI